ncbi:hypothetical protein DPV78_002584 [Talaromyces pinophilus]|nr:hypothetical protein DPV78_002584 [Talaromyces pinophilus]
MTSLCTSIWNPPSITAQHPPATNVSYLSAAEKSQDKIFKELYLHIPAKTETLCVTTVWCIYTLVTRSKLVMVR